MKFNPTLWLSEETRNLSFQIPSRVESIELLIHLWLPNHRRTIENNYMLHSLANHCNNRCNHKAGECDRIHIAN